jgi:hypothetical protein
MSEERLNSELAAIEAALCSLKPAPSNIQRDRLMFLAGKASATCHIPKLLWPMTTAASLLAATVFGALWVVGSSSASVNPVAGVSVVGHLMTIDFPTDTSSPLPWANRRLCQLVLEKGIDAMPESSGGCVSGKPSSRSEGTNRSLLRKFLDNPNS